MLKLYFKYLCCKINMVLLTKFLLWDVFRALNYYLKYRISDGNVHLMFSFLISKQVHVERGLNKNPLFLHECQYLSSSFILRRRKQGQTFPKSSRIYESILAWVPKIACYSKMSCCVALVPFKWTCSRFLQLLLCCVLLENGSLCCHCNKRF